MTAEEKQLVLDSLRFKVDSIRNQCIKYNWRRNTPEHILIDNKLESLARDVCSYGWGLFPDMMGR